MFFAGASAHPTFISETLDGPNHYNAFIEGAYLLLLNFFMLLRNSGLWLVLAAGVGYAQSAPQPELPPREVNLCDLLRNASSYDGQRIRVRAEANRDFEDFSLRVSLCRSQARRVWLQYGDQQTNAGTEVGHRFVQAEPLVKDAQFEVFAKHLPPQRLLQPDLKSCSGPQCHYYRVTATFSGRFFAGVEPGRSSGAKTFAGFGHGDCCHLLVIEQLSDVTVDRTQVPVGGQFQCSTETWTPASAIPMNDPSQTIATAAKHWGDDTSQGTIRGTGNWIAPDLLTSYAVETVTSPDKSDKKAAPDAKTTVIRESCQALQSFAPRPLSEPVSCETRQWQWQENRQIAKDIQQSVTMGHDPWRLELRTTSRNAIDDAHKQWALLPASPHMADSCSNPTMDDGQSAECGWSTPDGMQMFMVRLHRFDYLKKWGGHWEHVIWIATEVDGSFCHVAGEQEKQ